MAIDDNRIRVALRWPSDVASEQHLIEFRYRVPPGWSETPASESRILLLPDDLERFADERFAPNIVFDVSPDGSSGEFERPSPVFVSSLLGDMAGSHGQSGVFLSVLDEKVVVQLTAEYLIDGGRLSLACSALEQQWSSVVEDFDHVVDSLEVDTSVSEGRSQ